MTVGFIGTEGDMCPDAGCSIHSLGIEFPHVGLVCIRDIVFLAEVIEEGFECFELYFFVFMEKAVTSPLHAIVNDFFFGNFSVESGKIPATFFD